MLNYNLPWSFKYIFDSLSILSVARNSCLKPLCCVESAKQLLCSQGCPHFFNHSVFPAFPFGHFAPTFSSKSLVNILLHAVLKSPLLVSLMTLLLYSTFYMQHSYPWCYPNPHILFSWLLSQTPFPLLFCLNPYSQTIFP